MNEAKRWTYKTQTGKEIGYVVRIEQGTKKQIIPHFMEDRAAGVPDDLPPQHRLYGLDSLRDLETDPVFIVEGEKCAHALQSLGYQCLTSLGGAGQAHLADWSPLGDAKSIYLVPDNDEAGEAYVRAVYDCLRKLSATVYIQLLRLPVGPKGDVCDFLRELPALSDWNELDSLGNSLGKNAARSILDEFALNSAIPIPQEWHFSVTKHKYKLISVNDFTQIELPKRDTLLSPWLTEGSINMVFADRGVGKTFFCLSCAVALANGDSFLSYDADIPVPVLYLDGEMQATAMQQRLKELTKGQPTKAPLQIFTPDCQDLTDHIPDVGAPLGREEVDALVREANPKVVFIDNISTFIRTGHENEGDSWAPVQEWAVQLRKRGIAVVFIHHANKEGKQRGSHKKEDVMDIVLQLKRPDDYIQGQDETRLLIKYTKSRHMGAQDTQDLEATLKTAEAGLIWEWAEAENPAQRAMELLGSGMTQAEAAEIMDVSPSTINRWKKRHTA